MTPSQAIAAAKAKGIEVTVGPASLGMLRLPKRKPKREILTGQPIRWAIEFSIPCIVLSESNQSNRESWKSKMRRRHQQRDALYGAILTLGLQCVPVVTVGYRVTWTRVGGKSLDKHENLPIAFKGLVDHLAAWMGFENDADPALEWRYEQRPGGSPGVECRIESREQDRPAPRHR